MIHPVEEPTGVMWCGPTALASTFGLTYDEADALYRSVRDQKRRIVHTSAADTKQATRRLLRRRGINKWPFIVELSTNDGTPLTRNLRPRITSTKDIRQIASIYPGFVPAMLIIGKTHKKSKHIVAYDYKTKRLCDNWSRGIVRNLDDHPLKDWYVFKMIMVPEELYGRD